MTWTTETIAKFTRLIDEGHTAASVGLALGISRNAAIGKARRLNLHWHTLPIGGRARASIAPEKRRQVVELLKGGMSSIRVAAMTSVSPSTVKTIRAGRTPPPRAVTIPPLQTQETSMVVQDVRQAAFRVVEGPPVRAPSNVVTLAVSSRECSWTDGERGRWVHCCERRVKGPFCAEHALRGFTRRVVEEVA